mmetsp:Transcript_63719/g.206936  ORF Transcript_63719/g.206936 Transcript_63719/m.206936 type:complete len:274 (-) Transcript_63719:1235-2056(-)
MSARPVGHQHPALLPRGLRLHRGEPRDAVALPLVRVPSRRVAASLERPPRVAPRDQGAEEIPRHYLLGSRGAVLPGRCRHAVVLGLRAHVGVQRRGHEAEPLAPLGVPRGPEDDALLLRGANRRRQVLQVRRGCSIGAHRRRHQKLAGHAELLASTLAALEAGPSRRRLRDGLFSKVVGWGHARAPHARSHGEGGILGCTDLGLECAIQKLCDPSNTALHRGGRHLSSVGTHWVASFGAACGYHGTARHLHAHRHWGPLWVGDYIRFQSWYDD